MPAPPDCPGGKGYVPETARQLAVGTTTVTLVDLGITGATIGRDMQDLGNLYGFNVPGNMIQNELPVAPSNSTVFSVYGGLNDTLVIANAIDNGAAGSDPTGYINAKIQAVRDDYANLIQGLRLRAPLAEIVVINLPNVARLPFASSYPPADQTYFRQISVGIDMQVINPLASQGIPVVDLLCNAQSYQASNYYLDGLHPNDPGYSVIAAQLKAAISSSNYPPPLQDCSYMS